MERNSKGQFIFTTGKGRYKRINYQGKNIQYSRYVWIKQYGNIPNNLLVHHIDGNKYNNNLDNLALITIKGHNFLHRHPAWNKGIKASENKNWADTIKKAQANRLKTFLPKFKETFDLRNTGKKWKEISTILGISDRQAMGRVQRYKELIN